MSSVTLMASITVLFVLLLELRIMMICIDRINAQTYFTRFDRNTWMIIVIFGSIVGQCLYVLSEKQ
ncbi:hypothetical protein [Bacillus massiliigorillae]|uniref:hypothetical protein n=1 Tax=Bacillus massiliigorillae TaxID=1243664 RepID=UPI0005A851EA|nr:hypothetical protein [Bacillus massiliigorillae]